MWRSLVSQSKPFFEVILPSCDRPRLVQRAMASVLGQTWADWRLWLLDMSSEENWERIKRWWDENGLGMPHLKDKASARHWRKEDVPRGRVPYSWTTNQVWNLLRPDAFASYLTDDAYYPPDRLEAFAAHIAEHPACEAVYGEQIRINRGVARFPEGAALCFMPARPVLAAELAEHNWIDHNALVHKVHLLNAEEKPWVEELKWIKVGDWKCWHKVIARTDIDFIKHVVALDEWHPNGLSEMNAQAIRDRFEEAAHAVSQ